MRKGSAFLAIVLLVACGTSSPRKFDESNPTGGTDPGSTGGNGANGQTGFATDGGGGPTCADPNTPTPGCSCPTAGATAPCWTGPANLRNVGVCKDGVITCERKGEFSVWSACAGERLPSSQGVDAACQPKCKGGCIPGAWRYCDEPNYCSWAKQDCIPDGNGGGTWGQCVEVPPPPECKDPFGSIFPHPFYDEECCVKAGYCCQVGGVNSPKSDGNCASAVPTCTEPLPDGGQ